MSAKPIEIQEELTRLLQKIFICMQDIAPLFLDPFIIESIEDNLILYRILTNYFGPNGKQPIPYAHQQLTSIRQVRNQIIHGRNTHPGALIKLYESISVLAKVIYYLGNDNDKLVSSKQMITNQLVHIADEWKRILKTKCGYCFPDIPDIIKIEKGNIALQNSPLPTPTLETNIAEQKFVSTKESTPTPASVPKNTVLHGYNSLEGTISNIKADYMTVMKGKRLIILDGKYKNASATFTGWNGNNCFVTIDNVGKRAIPLNRNIKLFLEDNLKV